MLTPKTVRSLHWAEGLEADGLTHVIRAAKAGRCRQPIFGDAHRRVTRTVAAALCRGKLSRLSTELRASAIGSRLARLDMCGLAITNRLIEWLNEVQSSCAIPW